MDWSFSPAVAPFATAWVPRLQNCESQLASPTASDGPTPEGPHPLAIARAEAGAPSSGRPSVDLVVAAWTPAQASAAITQITDGTGGCTMVQPKPAITAWPGHDGLLLRAATATADGWHQDAALARVGELTIGVTVTDIDSDYALSQAMTICDKMIDKARTAGIGKG